MISSYTITNQTVATNEALNFETNRVLTGCTATHVEGTPTFQLNKPGYYYVTFNATTVTNGAAGAVTIQLNSNGVAVPGAASTYYSEPDQPGNVNFTTIIKVAPSCCAVSNIARLTVVNTGVNALYTNVNLNITKIC